MGEDFLALSEKQSKGFQGPGKRTRLTDLVRSFSGCPGDLHIQARLTRRAVVSRSRLVGTSSVSSFSRQDEFDSGESLVRYRHGPVRLAFEAVLLIFEGFWTMQIWRSGFTQPVHFLAWLWLIGCCSSVAMGQTFSIDNAELVPANGTSNVLDLELEAGVLGNDTDSTMLSGTLMSSVDLEWNGSDYDVTGYTISSGSFTATDVSFSLIFGISAVSSNMGGDVVTIAPPSAVVGGVFAGSDHLLTINRGSIDAAGNAFDFAAMPLSLIHI